MPIFSDLSNISHYYSGGASSLNYLSGPYAGHSSIAAANYRSPPPTFSKPSSRLLSRGYTPHLATITENHQIARSGLSRINSPKMLFHSSPKYKIQKPISINTADIDVSSNRYRRNFDRPKVLSPRSSAIVTPSTNRTTKSPEKVITYSPREPSKEEEDSEEMYMPRIDQNFRTTIKRERTVVRLHTNRNLDYECQRNESDGSPSKRERRLEDKNIDEETQKHVTKWRENFEPEELTPNRRKREPFVKKPLSEKYVEKFLIKDKQDDHDSNNFFLNNNKNIETSVEEQEQETEENNNKETETYNISRRNSTRKSLPKVQSFHEIDQDVNSGQHHNETETNMSRRNSTRKSLPKVQSFHEICKTISSDKIDEDLNPGQHPIMRRNTRKLSNYDVMKQIRRNSAEINHEEIKILDELIKGENLDTKQNSEQLKQNIENEDPQENDVKKRKKFTKKKSNEKLVEDEEKEEKTNTTPQRRKIVKKKTTGSLDKAIEAITPNAQEEPKKSIPKISGTVEIDSKPNLKLVIDTIHVEETILTSSSPTSKKFKYNVIVEEVISPSIEKTAKLANFSMEAKKDNKKSAAPLLNKTDEIKKAPIKVIAKTKSEEEIEKEKMLTTKKEEPIIVETKAEQEKQKMLDKILGSKKDATPIKEDDKINLMDGKTKRDHNEVVKKIEPLMNAKTKAEEEKQKMLIGNNEPPLEQKKELIKKIDPLVNSKAKAEQEKQKMLDMLMGEKEQVPEQKKEVVQKIEPLVDVKTKAEQEKQMMLDVLIGKKEPVLEQKKEIVDAKIKAEQERQKILNDKAKEEKQKMLDKIIEQKKEIIEKMKEKSKAIEDNKIKSLNKLPQNVELTKTKSNEEMKSNLPTSPVLKEPQKSVSQTDLPHKLGTKISKPEPIPESQSKTSLADKRKTLEKQENEDEITSGNFWDIIGKRETVYYQNRRKYLEEKRLQDNKNSGWSSEDEKENNAATSDPYAIDSEVIAKSKASDARLRQKLAEMESSNSVEIKKVDEIKVKPVEDKQNNEIKKLEQVAKKTSEVINKPAVLEKQKTVEIMQKPELKKSSTEELPISTKISDVKSIPVVSDKQKTVDSVKKPELNKSSSELLLIGNKTNEDINKPVVLEKQKSVEIVKKPELNKCSSEVLSIGNKTSEDRNKPVVLEKPKTVEIVKKPELNKCSSEVLSIGNKTSEDRNKPVVLEKPKTVEIVRKPELKKSSTQVLPISNKPEIKKVELVVKKTVEAVVPTTKKQKVSKYPQKVKSSEIKVKPQNSVKTDTQKRAPKLSVKQKSEEKIEKKIRPRLQRQSKSFEYLNKEKIKLTPVQIAEMKAIVRDIQLEPLKPELDFIIQEEYNPALKPNEDLVVPTVSQYKKIKPQLEEMDKRKRGEDEEDLKKSEDVPLQSLTPILPDPKPKAKPKWFDECPVVIMATPRDLRTRTPIHRRKPEPVPKVTYVSDSDDSDTSDDSGTSSSTSGGSDEYETNIVFNNNQANKWKSTSSNDSGFDSSAPGSPANNRNRTDDCDVNCHKKCEKLTANLCGVNQKLIVEALSSVKKGSSTTSISNSSSESPAMTPATNPAFTLEPMEASSAYTAFQRSGRVTPPATSIPRFRKYMVEDFCFLKVLGKGSFGKVLLAELRNTEYYYAVKCLKKDIVLEDDDVECTLIERKVLALGTKHPYLCHLFCTFQTESHLFFVMEYLNGGDLMFHIQMSGRFPEPRGKFYGAEIVSGLKFLHSKGIVYRDLKLDNILLDFDGHVRIADFGMCKLQIFLDRTADTFCGTPDYMAPEIIKGQHYNQGVDWWSFGVLLYEMLIGQSPFSGCDEDELFWSICNERPVIPGFLSQEASQILTLLLEKDSAKRLGNKYCIAGDIIDQPFFKSIDWPKLECRQLEAPFRPKVQHPLDTQYFDKAFTAEKVKLTPIEKEILHSMDQTQFHGFSYTNPNATDK